MPPQNPGTQERVKQYFRVKARQLSAAADLPVCEHAGLVGGHREAFQRVYLREVLPRRYEIDRGMVYGLMHRSKEADIVIWDALNYPSLPMLDHSFFFAESVRSVVECKSTWSVDEFLDVREKCRSVRNIVPLTGLTLADELESIWQEIASLREGIEHHGALLSKHHIGTAAVFLKGGQTFGVNSLTEETIVDVDDSWPDLLLLVEAGCFVVKQYESTGGFGGTGWLEFYELGEDALLAFTNGLLTILSDRSVHSEEPFCLSRYAQDIADVEPVGKVDFPLYRFVPQRMPLWRAQG